MDHSKSRSASVAKLTWTMVHKFCDLKAGPVNWAKPQILITKRMSRYPNSRKVSYNHRSLKSPSIINDNFPILLRSVDETVQSMTKHWLKQARFQRRADWAMEQLSLLRPSDRCGFEMSRSRNVRSKCRWSMYLQFSLLLPASWVLHRLTSRVIHRLELWIGSEEPTIHTGSHDCLGQSTVWTNATTEKARQYRQIKQADIDQSLEKSVASD